MSDIFFFVRSLVFIQLECELLQEAHIVSVVTLDVGLFVVVS